jgi:putative ABC transport system permease protein
VIATGVRLATAHRRFLPLALTTFAGVALLVSGVTFTSSLDHLEASPELYGFTWDAAGRRNFGDIDVDAVERSVADLDLDRVGGLTSVAAEIDDTPVPGFAVTPIVGNPWPPLVAGRTPSGPGEIVVGRQTMAELGLSVGDRLEAVLFSRTYEATPPRAFVVVGSVVAPSLSQPGEDGVELGTGFLMSAEDYAESYADDLPEIISFDLGPGATVADVQAAFPDGLPIIGESFGTEWLTDVEPAQVTFATDTLPLVWLGVTILGLAIVLVITLGSWQQVNASRRTYAELKTIGFTGRDVRRVVGWQSLSLALPALALAVPVGIAGGRWLWTAFARDVGVIVVPVAPVGLVTGLVLAIVALTQLAGLIPGNVAARTRPAVALREE